MDKREQLALYLNWQLPCHEFLAKFLEAVFQIAANPIDLPPDPVLKWDKPAISQEEPAHDWRVK